MPLGVHKPGQGYWTRVMTAIAVGVLGLAGSGWAWRQLAAIQTSFPIQYLQAGVAGGLFLLVVVLVYWLVGVKRSAVEFFIATEGEMQKVNWSTRKEVMGSTWVVVSVSVIIATVLFVTDLGFSQFFRLINVLQN